MNLQKKKKNMHPAVDFYEHSLYLYESFSLYLFLLLGINKLYIMSSENK